MSVSYSTRGIPSSQPFQCLICQSRFTRHENLKRHALRHSRSQDEALVPCDFCSATFSRPDLHHRHMKRKHPEHESRPHRKRSPRQQRDQLNSVSPPESQTSVNSQSWQGTLLQYTPNHLMNDPHAKSTNLLLQTPLLKPVDHLEGPLHPISFSQPASLHSDALWNDAPDDLPLSALQMSRGCDLFFAHVSHFVPFLHQPTFDTTRVPPHLLLSMLCLAYQYGEDPECDGQAGSGMLLSRLCFHRARALVGSVEGRVGSFSHNVSMVQSYLLLQICAMMYLCGEDSSYGLKMHSDMIALARAGGLMQAVSVKPAVTEDLESLWREFIKAESHKRTVFAVHQVDALWYQFLSIPRSISHLEIKHDLPCPEDHWAAASPAEWAHRQLVVARLSGPALQYADAIRHFLAPDADPSAIPAFDPYGTINIAQFLMSSAREISGWSTMTGMLSMDRFAALRSSLVALGPFISSSGRPELSRTPCTATWETAMIELQIWSPSHTGGIVEASIDAVLNQPTYLAPSSEILCEANTAKAIQPHVDWFLRYLDTTVTPDSEAPWVALYAYKAFLIAWQLVLGKVSGAMHVVGVQDGDVGGALLWARKVFQRRDKWQLGRLIVSCLDNLHDCI